METPPASDHSPHEPVEPQRPSHLRKLPSVSDMPLFVVMNGASGSNDTDEVRDAIVERLQAAKRDFRVYVIRNPRDIQKLSEQAVEEANACHGCVVVAGGDGTINTVANAAYSADCNLGVIPLGTFNYTGRTYGIPADPGDATTILLGSSPRNIQAGLVNERLFLVNAGLGFQSHLLMQREKHKAQLGRSQGVALLSALISLRDLPSRLTLEIEHDAMRESRSVGSLFVGNNVLQLQQMGLLEGEGMPTQTLKGVVLEPVTPWQMLKLGYLAARGKIAEDEHIQHFPFHQMTVTRRGRRAKTLRVAVDGEVTTMKYPLTFRAAPRPLRLLLPEASE